ncbi:MAG: ATP synthase F1 subunit gamma [Myxococcota bacterium]|nr:ATP synthase F1 subunit gamma [Myxococcota bacterium]
MASLRDIRNRIKSVKNTQKITGAMKLVAASKLRRAQDRITAARPYALSLGDVLRNVVGGIADQEVLHEHPLLAERNVKRVLLLVATSDRGLCGAFNTNVVKRAELFLRENSAKYDEIRIGCLGRKGMEYFRKRYPDQTFEYPEVFDKLVYETAANISESLGKSFIDGNYDAVYVIFNEFKSAMTQILTLEQLLPVAPEIPDDEQGANEYIFEPSAGDVLESLVPKFLATSVWRVLLESVAAEHASRMTAMDSATKNAKELSDKLTLAYNRARQASITQELMEIVGGAEALN